VEETAETPHLLPLQFLVHGEEAKKIKSCRQLYNINPISTKTIKFVQLQKQRVSSSQFNRKTIPFHTSGNNKADNEQHSFNFF